MSDYYNPSVPNAEGLGLIKVALRDFLAADLLAEGLPSVIGLLPNGAASIIDEGFLSEAETPLIMFNTVGDGQSAGSGEDAIVRLLVYVIDRGKGLLNIERVLHRVRLRLNAKDTALRYLTLHPSTGLRIDDITASGSAASTTLKAWKAEARGIYLFLTVKGLEATY